MLLLHISDIHFRAPVCGTPGLDPDRPYRTRLLQDVREQTTSLGPVGAILVGGDIAFKGAPEEYAAALTWLGELANVCGCPLERIFVIPGNHDVDRSVIRNNPSVRNAQQAIIRALPARREQELLEQFRDGDTGRALLAPLAAYNDFAARFNCQVFPPEKLYWHQDLPLNSNVRLRIYGLTSPLLSGAGAPEGREDTRESLYLSPLQTVLDPVAEVVNLVLCHHPPDWFMDQDDVDDAIRGRAALHLFGHKHRQRIDRSNSYIRFSAGAVNPDRYEVGWQPAYNLIRLDVEEGIDGLWLVVEAHLRSWQSNPEMFRPIMDLREDPVFRHRLPIQHSVAPTSRSSAPAAASIETVEAASSDEPIDTEAVMSETSTRNLVFRFWSLASSQRRDIASRLGLLDQEEMRLPEPERYGRALMRAGERGLLELLAEEVGRMEE